MLNRRGVFLSGVAPIVVVMALALCPAPVRAQEGGDRVPVADAGRGPVNVISGNPLLFLFPWLNLEYFRTSGNRVTWGIAGDLFLQDSDEWSQLSAVFRFYPEERAPAGFFVGGRLGWFTETRIDYPYYDYPPNGPEPQPTETRESYGSFSLEVGYDFLMGSEKDFYLSVGGGVTRVLGDDPRNEFLPILRIANVGWAF